MKLGNLQNIRDQLVFLRNKENQLNKPDKEERKATLSALIQRIDDLAVCLFFMLAVIFCFLIFFSFSFSF